MSVTVYSKPDCPWCIKAKEMLSEANIPYTELMIGVDVSRNTVLEKFPGVKVAPIIVVGEHRLEGAKELETLIRNDQLKDLI